MDEYALFLREAGRKQREFRGSSNNASTTSGVDRPLPRDQSGHDASDRRRAGSRTEGLMVKFTHILCPTDLSEGSLRSLRYAAGFARSYDARLTVLHVVPTFEPIAVPSSGLSEPVQVVFPMSRAEVLGEIRDVIDAAGAASISTTVAAYEGDPATTIVDRSLAIGADLLVMGTHGRSGFERLLIGSVAESVLQKAPCPVLLVPPHVTGTVPADVKFKNILCPVDFSPSSLQALGFALDLGRQGSGVVTVLHALEWLAEEEPRTDAHFNVPEYRQYLLNDARHRVQALLAGEPPTSSATHEMVVAGRAHREILRVAADSGVDLIVMGAQGRGGLGLTLFGSTTQQVVRSATCPVLTVRGAGVAT
jgi:nucleotide-binding universal stress UspA family protein